MNIYERTDYELNITDPTTCRLEMRKLLSSIEALEHRINVRDLIVEALYKNEGKRPQELIEELHTILEDTERALQELEEIRENLSLLGEELSEMRTVIL